MSPTLLIVLGLLALGTLAYRLGRQAALATVGGEARWLHSLAGHYGLYMAFWCCLPGLVLVGLWLTLSPVLVDRILLSSLPADYQTLPDNELSLVLNDIKNLAAGTVFGSEHSPEIIAAAEQYNQLQGRAFSALVLTLLGLASGGLAWSWRRIAPSMPAIRKVESVIHVILFVCSTVAVLTTIGIVFSLLIESIRFFQRVPITEFLFGLEWSPQTALRADQIGSSGSFGAVPVFTGTLLISGIAMLVAAPIGLLSAVYLSEYAASRIRNTFKPILEILAGVPTVVYGFFAALTVAPAIRDLGSAVGLDVASESALAAGAIMGVMIIPFVSSISDDVIAAIPSGLREASVGLGATRSETIRRVIVPAALPGIVAGLLLAISRAIGETMIVVMAAGLTARLTANPLEAVTTVTVQIVTLLVGDQEFDSAKTLSAFALGLVLFLVTLVFNVASLKIVRKYREQYE